MQLLIGVVCRAVLVQMSSSIVLAVDVGVAAACSLANVVGSSASFFSLVRDVMRDDVLLYLFLCLFIPGYFSYCHSQEVSDRTKTLPVKLVL